LLEAQGVDLDAIGNRVLDQEGRWLVFETDQALGVTDTNGLSDVYRLDLIEETLTLLSRTPDGYAGNGPSSYPAPDWRGEWLVFQSDADDLVADDANGVSDIFIYDVWTGEIKRITWDSRRASAHPVLAREGEELFYDQVRQGGQRQILADTVWSSGVAQPISFEEDEAGLPLDNHHPAISADGRFVAYLEESGSPEDRICNVHLLDRDTGNYQIQACPTDLQASTKDTRPRFRTDGGQIEWHVPGADSPVVIPNTLQSGDSRTSP
jgi:Tol biopolymer transport system component